MRAARQMPRALIAMGASLAVLTACSASTGDPTVDAGACTGASPAELTAGSSGEVCADNGFHPATDGFSFSNWGGTPTDDAIDSSTLIAMFGREPVCSDSPGAGCTMRPAAKAWMEQMNEALANGRCEGMAVLSERLFDGLARAAELDPRAQRTIDLARTQPTVARTLGYWWLTQFPTEVATPTAQTRKLLPSQMINEVIAGLESKAGNTLGLYSEFGGHAVTPIAVVKEGSNYTISVYDSNDPGVIKHVLVDPTAESWVYDATSNSSGVITERWRGAGAGSMDLTPMALRTGAFTAPFGDGPNADTYVTVTSPKDGTNLGAIITRGNTVLDTRALTSEVPDDFIVHRITGTGAGVQVIIKGDAGALEVTAVSGGAPALATLSVDAPGTPMITARGRTGSTKGKALTVTRSADGQVEVESGSDSPVRTTISTESETVHLTAPTSTGVHVTRATAPQASLVDASGSTLATYDTAESAPEVVSSIALELNAQSDGFTVARSLVVAESPAVAPVIDTAPAPSPTASASASRERKEKSENERGKRSERPSKSRGEKSSEATPTASATPQPSRTRTPERSHGPGSGHSSSDTPRTPGTTPSGAPALVTSASPSMSASVSASASGSGSGSASPSTSPSPSATASTSASATPGASVTPSPSASASRSATPTPTPSSTKKKDEKRDKPRSTSDDDDSDDD